jgi:hypothetical protein
MVKKSTPSFYEEIPAPELTAEANQDASLPKAYSADLLPFHLLGGRRFEILAYLYFRDAPPEENAAVTLVKSSGDKGRDVLIHSNGSLRTVIQCKALEGALSRPALVRELVKLALFNRLEHFLPKAGIEYQIWAPGGLSEPASTLVAEAKHAQRRGSEGGVRSDCRELQNTLEHAVERLPRRPSSQLPPQCQPRLP